MDNQLNELHKVPELPKEIYTMILKYTNPLPIYRLDLLCTCKLFLELCLTHIWQPWKHHSNRRLRIYMDDRQSICYDGPVTGLLWAISEGYLNYFRHWNAVAASFGEPFDVSVSGWYPFKKSVENGHFEFIKYILHGHPDDPHFTPVHPSVQLNQALETACFNRRVDIIKLLLEDERIILSDEYIYGTKEPNYEYHPLSDAVCGGDPESVKLILSDKRISTPPIANIVKIKHITPEVFKLLWNDERIERVLGRSIMHRILTCYSDDSMFNNAEVASLIISDPKYNLTFEEGENYIKLAYTKNRPKILKLLLRHPVMKDFDYEKFREEEMKKPPRKKGLLDLICDDGAGM